MFNIERMFNIDHKRSFIKYLSDRVGKRTHRQENNQENMCIDTSKVLD